MRDDRERELERTARARGRPTFSDPAAEAMHEAERARTEPLERADPTSYPSVREALKPDNAVPVAAPVRVRRRMTEKMRRFQAAVDEQIPGESWNQRRRRLDALREELWPSDGCGCGGTGLVTRIGEYERRDGRSVPSVSWVEPCSCPYGLARRSGSAEPDTEDNGDLEDAF